MAQILHNDDVVHVRGGLGTLREHHLTDPRRPRWLKRVLAFLAVMGPGMIVMIGDNDAGGVTTYAQAGQAYGYSLLWLFPLLVIVLYVAQEMVGRLGAVTGVGHGKLLRERFGRFWAAFSVFDLFLLNFLTLLTEFIGIDLGARYFGIRAAYAVPIMAALLVALVLGRQFYRWERLVFVMVGVSMLMLVTPFISGGGRHAHWPAIAQAFVVPGVTGGLSTRLSFSSLALSARRLRRGSSSFSKAVWWISGLEPDSPRMNGWIPASAPS
jgi:Mn2+/Fe2+ NRAMP family transporter